MAHRYCLLLQALLLSNVNDGEEMTYQHIVSDFYIRNWRKAGVEKVWVYDKRTGHKGTRSPGKIFGEPDHYEAKDAVANGKTADKSLQFFEGTFAPVLKALPNRLRISASESVIDACKFVVSKFAVMQFLRGRMFKKWQRTETEFLDGTAQQFGFDRGEEHSPQKQQADVMLSQAMSDYYTDKLLLYTWSVRAAPEGSSFYLGDEPIVIIPKDRNSPPIFDSPGVEIHVPICPEFCFCITATQPGDEGQRSLTPDDQFVLWQRYRASVYATQHVVCRDDDFLACEAACRLHPEIADPTRPIMKYELVGLRVIPSCARRPEPGAEQGSTKQ